MAQALISNFVVKRCLIDISESTSLSVAIDLQGLVLIGVVMPAAWDAGNITFQGCLTEDGTYLDIEDEDGTELGWTGAAASKLLLATPTQPMIGGFPWLIVRSGVSVTPVVQTADRELWLLCAVINP